MHTLHPINPSKNVSEDTSPAERTRRNIVMAGWWLAAALVSGGIGWAVAHWTPIPLAMAPVFAVVALGYAIMAGASNRQ